MMSGCQRRFTSDVSHELRIAVDHGADGGPDVPLLQQSGRLSPEMGPFAELLQTSWIASRPLLVDLLEISRYDAGWPCSRLKPVDLRGLVRGVIEATGPSPINRAARCCPTSGRARRGGGRPPTVERILRT